MVGWGTKMRPATMPGAAVQLLAQDYAALKQSAKFAALYREMQKSHPEVAMSLQSQFRDAIGAPAPEVSPRTLAALAVPGDDEREAGRQPRRGHDGLLFALGKSGLMVVQSEGDTSNLPRCESELG